MREMRGNNLTRMPCLVVFFAAHLERVQNHVNLVDEAHAIPPVKSNSTQVSMTCLASNEIEKVEKCTDASRTSCIANQYPHHAKPEGRRQARNASAEKQTSDASRTDQKIESLIDLRK